MRSVINGLVNYADFRVYPEVISRWVAKLYVPQATDIELVRSYCEEMNAFLQTSGIIGNFLARVQLGEVVLPDLPNEPVLNVPLVVYVEKDEDDRVELFSPGLFLCRVGHQFNQADATKNASKRFAHLINTGQARVLRDALQSFIPYQAKERVLVERAVESINDFFDIAVPRTLTISAVVFNSGKFASAILRDEAKKLCNCSEQIRQKLYLH